MISTRIRAISLAIVFAASCGASTPAPSATGPAASARPATESITVAATLTLTTLDGILSSHVESTHTVYDQLVRIKPDGSTTPDLATKWSANADATEWTFTLRSGVKFSDGSPLSADDVVWSFTSVLDTQTSLIRPNLTPFMTSVTKLSDTEVLFKLKTPFAAWPRQTTLVNIVPKKAYETIGAATFASKPVGSGPYMVTNFVANQEVTYEINPNYWGTKPTIKKVIVKFIPSETTRLTAIQSRAVDVAELSPVTTEAAKSDAGLTVKTVPSNHVSYLGFNVSAAGLKELKLRQAIDVAIDRAAIAKTLFKGEAEPIGQLVAPATVGYDPSLKPTAYDPNKAKDLVRQSGYDGKPIPFVYPIGTAVPQAAQIAQAIDGYLKAAGINLDLKAIEQATLQQDWVNRKFAGMYLFSYQPSTLDANIVVSRLYLKINSAYADDPTLEALTLKSAAQADPATRQATLVEMQKRSNDNVYYAPLLNASRVYVWVPAKLKIEPRADGYMMPQYMAQP